MSALPFDPSFFSAASFLSANMTSAEKRVLAELHHAEDRLRRYERRVKDLRVVVRYLRRRAKEEAPPLPETPLPETPSFKWQEDPPIDDLERLAR